MEAKPRRTRRPRAKSWRLVIAEKPSVGRDIAAALEEEFEPSDDGTYLIGKHTLISWAVGHLVSLAEPELYDEKHRHWRFAHLPILPERFKLRPADARSGAQLKALHALMRREDVTELINACDAGREGELVFAYLMQTARVRKPVKRLWLQALTKAAIRTGFENLRESDELKPLEAAARSRAEADWIVGLNATRAATLRLRKNFDGAVSLGRVQTPTLALLARRELAIREFVPEDYWTGEAEFESARGDRYQARYEGGRRLNADEAAALVLKADTKLGTISAVEKKPEILAPPLLYDLTTLQRDVNTRYGFSAGRTLAAAQRLYEARKAITYPRSSSRYLPTELVPELPGVLEKLAGLGGDWAGSAGWVLEQNELRLERSVDPTRVSDHHALIPTTADYDPESFESDERRVFELIAKRFLCSFYPDAEFERTRVTTELGEARFRSSGRRLAVAGWWSVYGEEPVDENSEDDGLLPELAEGEQVTLLELQTPKRQTQPPRRFSDASLLAAMETAGKEVEEPHLREALKDSGLGTPATRAQIIERLIEAGYLEREGRALRASDKGVQVIELISDHPLASAELTGEWEHRLAEIEAGRDSRASFMSDIARFTTETVKRLDKLAGVKVERANLGPCPVCGRDIIENRRAYSCWTSKDPGCGFVIWKRKAGRILPREIVEELVHERRTTRAVEGFRGRSGRRFKAKLALEQDEQGRWQVGFDEDWAREQDQEARELVSSSA